MDESYVAWLRLIPGVTPDLARRIAERYPDPELLKGTEPKDLAAIPGVTEDLAARVLELVRTAARSDEGWYKDRPSLYLCPECGSFVGKGSTACPFCGVVFEEGEAAEEAPAPVEELLRADRGEAKICTSCGAFIGPGETACAMCGTEYPAERLAELPAVDLRPVAEADLFLCPHCGAFLGEGAESCAICGRPVTREERVPGLAGKGMSKDFLTRWQRAAEEERPAAPEGPLPPGLEDELARYDRLLEKEPANERGWVRKGRILIELGRTAEAVACFDRAAQLNPERDESYKLEVLSALGPMDWSVLPPRWAGEVEAVRPAVEPVARPPEKEAEPEEGVPPERIVAAASEVAAVRRAIAYYDRLLRADPTSRIAWMTRAELLMRLDEREAAGESLRRAAELAVAEREVSRTALAGLESRGLGRARAGAPRAGRPAGRTNGRVNGLTNGLRGRTNGLRGRTNGLTNGLRGRTNGFVNGLRGRTNGLVNGTGATNGLGYATGRVNGLVMGMGRTNGLVNGNGFTNGRRGRLAGARAAPSQAWARSVTGIAAVVFVIVVAPIVASMFTAPPPPMGIAIDGSFSDWQGVPLQYNNSGDRWTVNPDVNIASYKVLRDAGRLYVLAHVQGVAMRGADGGADAVLALIDTDGRADTGYDAGGIGADMLAEIVGWDNRVSWAYLNAFSPAADRKDWLGFRQLESLPAAASGQDVEFSVDVGAPTSARILLAAVDGLGRAYASDAAVVAGSPALSVREATIAPGIIGATADVGILRIDLESVAAGLPAPVTWLNVTKTGSLADSEVTLSLYRDDGDGLLGPADVLLGTSNVVQGRATFPVSGSLAGRATYLVTADFATLPPGGTFGLALAGIAAGGAVTVASRDLGVSYLAGAPAPTVDGAFADWNGVPRSADPVGDVANRSGVASVVDANVDLTEVASDLGANATFYLRVDGTMLGGVDVPNLRARTPPRAPADTDLDTVPDNVEIGLGPDLPRDFNNDNLSDAATPCDVDQDGLADFTCDGPDLWLNTTIPDWYPSPYGGRNVSVYIGPVAPQHLIGVDSAIVYLDGDNSTATGLRVMSGASAYGLDWAIVVMGRHGAVVSSGLYRYRAGPSVPWEFVRDAPAAADATRLEVSAPDSVLNLSAGYRTLYYATDWRLTYDVAVPVPPGRSPAPGIGTRNPLGTNVVINEVIPQPNPEAVELANPTSQSITLSGWQLQRNKGPKWETFWTFTSEVIGAWGSGSEYLSISPPTNSLPNGNVAVRLVDASGAVVDLTSYPAGVGTGNSWSRFKDASTGKPVDTDNDANDFYVSTVQTLGLPNSRHRPTIVVAKTANKATAAPGDQIVYTVYYNNTDTGRANHVWINDTLPAQVTFVSSSVTPTGSSGQTYRWQFTNVDPSTNNLFTITVKVNDGTGNGVVLVNTAALNYTDQLNRMMTASASWRNVTVWRPVITVAKIGDKRTALPGDTIVYTIYYNNTGFAAAAHVWINDTLPRDVTFLSSSVPPSGSSGQRYFWHFTNVGVGAHSFTISVRVNLNATSSALVNWVFLNYTSQNSYKLEQSSASFTTMIPEFADVAAAAVLVPVILIGMGRWRRRKRGE